MRPHFLAAAFPGVLLVTAAHLPLAFGQSIVITQSLEQTHALDPAELQKFPAVEQRVSFHTGHGTDEATYTGALLWSVLEQAGALDGEPRARLRRIVTVSGRDGYTAALALAEIDPEFEGKQVLLAYRRDGEPMPGNQLRLVVPGDRRGGRSVRDVVKMELR
ncbi:MAG: molybdopterin-dependent oxidoreductase [Acetobacteraceae bacterium]|nr:molybdopterin-dependent oxidoreductase [Acetobacteraceae bacterium]